MTPSGQGRDGGLALKILWTVAALSVSVICTAAGAWGNDVNTRVSKLQEKNELREREIGQLVQIATDTNRRLDRIEQMLLRDMRRRNAALYAEPTETD